LNDLLKGFSEVEIQKNEYQIIIDSETKFVSRVFDVLAFK